jgi:hypothetical protein
MSPVITLTDCALAGAAKPMAATIKKAIFFVMIRLPVGLGVRPKYHVMARP